MDKTKLDLDVLNSLWQCLPACHRITYEDTEKDKNATCSWRPGILMNAQAEIKGISTDTEANVMGLKNHNS